MSACARFSTVENATKAMPEATTMVVSAISAAHFTKTDRTLNVATFGKRVMGYSGDWRARPENRTGRCEPAHETRPADQTQTL